MEGVSSYNGWRVLNPIIQSFRVVELSPRDSGKDGLRKMSGQHVD